ncbi:zinc finger CCHC domain-containing protein 2 isoform X2 [Antennarius striatus]|uniref:zinc finger CCHC domain-containing protein 2 isoform X2 n=1 Tax=Antennarius striatus TaxID=241820 RepID=UPI0035B2F73F
MLKMKLPTKTGEEGGDKTPEDNSLDRPEQLHIPRAVPPSAVPELESPGPCVCPSHLNKEAVFEWFGLHLNPAKRIEFMCGLLHMCQPLELRFLGSYLEDLARKDYLLLRDFEFRANNPSELGLLTDVLDPVVLSKLLVCLSLLGSDSRECSGILFRILNRVDPTLFFTNHDSSPPLFGNEHHPGCEDRDHPVPAAGPLEQLALLFMMASLHPAFLFHQREKLRRQLEVIEWAVEDSRQSLTMEARTEELTGQKVDYLPSPTGLGECVASSHPPCQSRCHWTTQREVHIEGIVLRGITLTRKDKEYNFEVKWSDSSSSSVTKTHLELENFLLKLPEHQCAESFETSILRLLNQEDQSESRDVEENLREKFLSAPPVFRQTRKVCSFFTCDSSYSTPSTCCRCSCQLGTAYQGDCSASSQEEDFESYAQGHKKKHGTKSPCQGGKGSQGDSRRAGGSVELNGPAERRKACTLRSSQEPEQHAEPEKRIHPVNKTKSRGSDRSKGKGKGGVFLTNGRMAPSSSSHRKDEGSGPDTVGESSSESYSPPPSPQHRPESWDSEEDNNRDTDSHSEDVSRGPGRDVFFSHRAGAAVGGAVPSFHPPETSTDFPPLSLPSFMHSLPYMHPNGAADPPPSSQNVAPDVKPSSVTMMMPLVPPAANGAGSGGESEKRDTLPTFGVPPISLHPSGNPALQPVIQRFKIAPPHSQGGSDGASSSTCGLGCPPASHQVPVRAVTVMSHGPSSYPSPLQPVSCQSASSGLAPPQAPIEAPHSKRAGLTLPSGLPPPYTLPPTPTSVLPPAGAAAAVTRSPGHVQAAAAPPAVPTHTPGPAPSPIPALTHSTAHSDCTMYSNSSASCGSAPVTPGNPITVQQTQQQQLPPQQQPPPPSQTQQQQQPMGCGTCGCHNNCGGQASISNGVSMAPAPAPACQAPVFYPPHQMAAARQVFSVPPPLFQLTSLCSNTYLSQAQPPHQNNGTATLSPFFPTAPPPTHQPPFGPLHTHPHSHADAHILSTQVAVAAANYSLQQQMVPAASFCQRVFQQHVYPNPLGLLPPAAALGGGGINKKNGNVSCYNCGVTGHYAHDCSQPSIDATQQGGFRLKYAVSHISEALDNGE